MDNLKDARWPIDRIVRVVETVDYVSKQMSTCTQCNGPCDARCVACSGNRQVCDLDDWRRREIVSLVTLDQDLEEAFLSLALGSERCQCGIDVVPGIWVDRKVCLDFLRMQTMFEARPSLKLAQRIFERFFVRETGEVGLGTFIPSSHLDFCEAGLKNAAALGMNVSPMLFEGISGAVCRDLCPVAGTMWKMDSGRELMTMASRLNASFKNLKTGSPIHAFVRSGRGTLDELKLILSKLDENDRDSSCRTGESPFFLACVLNHIQVAKVLLEFGANPNSKTENGDTPLIACSRIRKLTPVVQWLLENKADLHLVNDEGENALHVAGRHGCNNTISILLQGPEHILDEMVNLENNSGLCPISVAKKSSRGILLVWMNRAIMGELSVGSKTILWSPAWETGLRQVDEQHQQLVEMLNSVKRIREMQSRALLDESIEGCFLAGRAKAMLKTTLGALLDYTEYHFSTEETLMMNSTIFPEKEFLKHQKRHNEFISDVTSFLRRFYDGEVEFTVELLDFLGHWVMDHIQSGEYDQMLRIIANE